MSSVKFGYMRVSTIDQNLDRQEQQLKEVGCEQIFYEKITGTIRDRPELNRMLEFLRKGDSVVVTDLTRLSRSTKDLLEITELISAKGAHLQSLKESWLDTKSAHGKMLLLCLLALLSLNGISLQREPKKGLLRLKIVGKN